MGFLGLHPCAYDTGRVNRYSVDVANATEIAKYDGVEAQVDGGVKYLANAKSNNFLGSVASVRDSEGVIIDVLPASTVGYVDVYDDPNQEYLIQAKLGIAAIDRFGSFNLANTSVASVNGYSQAELSNTVGTSNQFKIVDKYLVEGNDWAATNGTAENTIVKVKASAHYFLSTPDALTS
jgi:hypothetical protein